ncbi:MAG: hypothetical protein ABSA70_03275 [Terriglobia bacterium]
MHRFFIVNRVDKAKFVMGAVAIWVALWLWWTRHYQLDDAFIHLKYAGFLWSRGFLTFDGVHRNHGTSSLLYVGLAASIYGFVKSAYVPKALSILSYLGLLMMVSRRVWRSQQAARVVWASVLVVLISPMAFRWLCDGMETSMAVLGSAVMGRVAYSISVRPTHSRRQYIWLFLLAAATVMLRIELCSLVAVATAAALLLRAERAAPTAGEHPTPGEVVHWVLRESHLAMGGCLAVLITYFWAGHLLPDTAVAKALGRVDIAQLWGVARAFSASFSLGIGLLLIWAICLVVAFRADAIRRNHLCSLLVANSVLPLMVTATVVRGQYVHGVRYFLWPLMFMIVWDVLLVFSPAPAWEQHAIPLARLRPRRRIAVTASLILLACVWGVEGRVVRRITADASQVYLEMRSDHLDALVGKPGMAFDVGLISYFSRAQVCDLSGLVNGRALAQAAPEERARYCVAQAPTFAFVTPAQAVSLRSLIDFDSWVLCRKYWLSNVAVREPHYLLVRPDVAREFTDPYLPKGKAELR